MSQLTSGSHPYLKEKQAICPSGLAIRIIVSKQEISFIDHQKKYRVVLPNNYFFNNIKEIYFNKDGNINQANHIDLIAPKKKYTIIFHLGAGDYEFK